MNILNIEKDCVGCGACVDSCPTASLKLDHNENGFYVPFFANDKCVDCGKCVKVCPVIDTDNKKTSPDAFYGWCNDEEIRKESTSGGAFSAIADAALKKGGVVFGAKYADDFKSIVMASTEECSLSDLRKSKYCQTRAEGMYKKIARHLKENRFVMLMGTPCQIAAARKMFGNNENLLLVDFICGGVSPDTTYKNYIEYMESKYNSAVCALNMRDKIKGWSKPHVTVAFANGKKLTMPYHFDYYNHYYYSPLLKNDQCIHCPFTNHSYADISIADFWGFRQEKIKNDDKGMSLICVYTEQGRKIFDEIKENMTLDKLSEKQIAYAFYEKRNSDAALQHRLEFLEAVKQTSFIEAAKNDHFKGGIPGILLRKLMRRLKIR